MRISTQSKAETIALETELERLEERAESIESDIAEARQNVADVQGRFIDGSATQGDLLTAEQTAAALESAAAMLQTRIAAKEKEVEKAHAAEVRDRKHSEALQIAAAFEAERAAAFSAAAATVEALATLPAILEMIGRASFQARRLRNLINSDNGPHFTVEDARRLEDLASEDSASMRATFYKENRDSPAVNTFRQLLEGVATGFTVAPPAPAAAPADLSDINFFAGADVQMRGMLKNRLSTQLDGMIAERENG